MIGRYRKRPVVIEAVQFTGHNDAEVLDFVNLNGGEALDPESDRPTIIIRTLEGDMTAEARDWIIRGVKGEFYSCKPHIFELTYEEADEERYRVPVSGVWLRKIGHVVQVLVEVQDGWLLVIEEDERGNYSHVVETSGIRSAKIDESLI